MFRARALALGALATLGGAIIAACGAGHPAGRPFAISGGASNIPLQLQLELPMVGMSSSSQVSYGTTEGKPVLRGLVQPAGTTVYMRDSQGRRTLVEPRRNGAFDIHARLLPGTNQFKFTAARLGTNTRSATLTI